MSDHREARRVVLLGSGSSPVGRRAIALGALPAGGAEADKVTASGAAVILEEVDGHVAARLPEWPRSALFTCRLDLSTAMRSTRSPLLRAAGTPSGALLDATAGFGVDAMTFAAAGWRVIACEREPIVAWLLEEGLASAAGEPRLAEVAARVELRAIDARVELERWRSGRGESEPPEVVFLDPMFPARERGKSALPPKEAQLLRALSGEDPDAGSLVDLARSVARRRVIVKRPAWAATFGEPAFSLPTKLLRLDVYLPRA